MTLKISPEQWDEEADVVILGSGAGGLTAATVAANEGLRVIVLEKLPVFGGGAAISGGVVWVPNHGGMDALGIEDSRENAALYLRGILGNRARWDLIDAYLDTAPEMVDYMRTRSVVNLVPRPIGPDYYSEQEGATSGGRMMDPAIFDGRELGPLFDQLRLPLPTFLLFGGMMVGKYDIEALLKAHKSLSAFRHSAALVGRYVWDRLTFHRRGTRLALGNALAGRLLRSAVDAGADLWSDTNVLDLCQSADGSVSGVQVERGGRRIRVKANHAVVLATGGFPGSKEMMRAHIPFPDQHHSMAPEANAGGGISLGLAAGGRLEEINCDNGFWAPVSVFRQADGTLLKCPHLIMDRAKPGLIAVNQTGQRFVNEALSYHDFVAAMHRDHAHVPTIPAMLICDHHFIRKYGLGLVRPGPGSHRKFIKAGYLVRANTIAELAEALSLPPETLKQTVEQSNGDADSGVDRAFGKGESGYNRYLGDEEHKGPNPCLGPILRAPFYAVRVYPGDIGTSLGLRTDAKARVVDIDERPVPGLYACGNDMNSVMAGTYPSGGITLGPAMTFGYVIARDIAAIQQGRRGA